MNSKENLERRVLVIGIDGATWTFLAPLIEQGRMPALARIVAEGTSGDLESSLPPVTATAWSNFITGKTPARHRMADFLIRKGCTYRETTANALDRRGRPFWETVCESGGNVGILNVPTTYPPCDVNGVIVGGFLSPHGKRDFVRPEGLLDELEGKFGPYITFPKAPFDVWESEKSMRDYVRVLSDMLSYKVKAARYIIEKERRDLVVLHIWGSDLIQHRFWSLMDPDSNDYRPGLAAALEEPIQGYFRQIDDSIAELRQSFGEDEAVIIMSDHGFGEVKKSVDLNAWFAKEGYIRFKKTLGSRIRLALWKLGFAPTAFLNFVIRVIRLLLRFVKIPYVDPGRMSEYAWKPRAPLFLSLNDADWSGTRAYSKIGIGQIVLNVKGREPMGTVEPGEEYDRLVSEIRGKLMSMTDPETNAPLFDRVIIKEERFSGEFADEMADIFIPPSEHGYVARTPSNIIFSSRSLYETPMKEGHRLNGVLAVAGAGIHAGATIDDARIEDMAPTILYHMGCEIPDDMDGRILYDLFTKEHRESREARFVRAVEAESGESKMSEAEKAEVLEKLRTLGYID